MTDGPDWRPELRVLGAGSALPRAGHGPAGYALRPSRNGRWTLLDCGPGSIRQLANVGLRVEDVERVVFSHWHTDHCLDLFALIFARRNPALGDLPRLDLVGPLGLRQLVERGPEALGHWVEDRAAAVEELVADAEGTVRFERPGLSGVGHENGHAPHAVSWRFELEGGRSLCYSGDSGEVPALERAARDADLFLCECAFPDAEAVEHHLTPSSAAGVARRAGARRVLLTHFYPSLDPEVARAEVASRYGGPVEAARDGLRVRI